MNNSYRLNLNKKFNKTKTKDCKTAATTATTFDRKKDQCTRSQYEFPSAKSGFYCRKRHQKTNRILPAVFTLRR